MGIIMLQAFLYFKKHVGLQPVLICRNTINEC